mgnify:CR=1 FL=1
MNTLILSGYGIDMHVDNSKLHIQDGNDHNKTPQKYTFKPKFIDLDNIVVYGHSGNITLDAIKWLTKQNVQLTILNWDGRLLTTILPVESKQSLTKMAQYRTHENGYRVDLAKKFIDAKIKNSFAVLKWLGERYPEVAKLNNKHWKEINFNWSLLPQAKSIGTIMGLEGKIANDYWKILSSIFDSRFDFSGRVYGKTTRPMGAVDPINALFNYGYSILASQCWKAINSNGLDPYVGFMHEMAQSKAPLVYDLQEPFRWLVDVAIISGLEKRIFTKKDFVRTENYNIRIRPDGVKKLMAELVIQFSKTVRYHNQNREWGYIVIQKAHELAHYLTGKKKDLDFSVPEPNLEREDTDALRTIIFNMPYSKWKKMGFSKGTLHYLKKNAKEDKPFKVYGKVKEKLGIVTCRDFQ